jgi:hypothetical protein
VATVPVFIIRTGDFARSTAVLNCPGFFLSSQSEPLT